MGRMRWPGKMPGFLHARKSQSVSVFFLAGAVLPLLWRKIIDARKHKV